MIMEPYSKWKNLQNTWLDSPVRVVYRYILDRGSYSVLTRCCFLLLRNFTPTCISSVSDKDECRQPPVLELWKCFTFLHASLHAHTLHFKCTMTCFYSAGGPSHTLPAYTRWLFIVWMARASLESFRTPSIRMHVSALHCVHGHTQPHSLRHGGGIPVRPVRIMGRRELKFLQ